MPIVRHILQDPPDLVVPGLHMMIQPAALKFPDVPEYLEGRWPPLIIDPPDRLPLVPFSIVPSPFPTGMLDFGSREFSARVFDQAVNLGIRVNACICTPCGHVVPVLLGHQWFVNDIGQSTVLFALSGVTRDGAGAPLGNCRVVVYESGRIAVGGHEYADNLRTGYATDSPVVGETISDGSGNYSVRVPMNTAYQISAYKDGAPAVFGTSPNTLTPVQE